MQPEATTLRHLHPVVGLTMQDTKAFFELLKKANKMQIEAMLIEMQNEIKDRINAKNW